jgi:hypothetical protein
MNHGKLDALGVEIVLRPRASKTTIEFTSSDWRWIVQNGQYTVGRRDAGDYRGLYFYRLVDGCTAYDSERLVRGPDGAIERYAGDERGVPVLSPYLGGIDGISLSQINEWFDIPGRTYLGEGCDDLDKWPLSPGFRRPGAFGGNGIVL